MDFKPSEATFTYEQFRQGIQAFCTPDFIRAANTTTITDRMALRSRVDKITKFISDNRGPIQALLNAAVGGDATISLLNAYAAAINLVVDAREGRSNFEDLKGKFNEELRLLGHTHLETAGSLASDSSMWSTWVAAAAPAPAPQSEDLPRFTM